jgi:hypothetical protein
MTMQRINARMFRPNLVECWLEERLVPATPTPGVIVGTTLNIELTTSGWVLITPSPGASNSAAGSLGGSGGSSSTAAAVSGGAFPTGIYVTGNRGISTFTPGNFTGNPNLGGAAGAAGGVSVTISVGSGAGDASAAVAPPVTRNTVANDKLNPLPVIGGPSSAGSGSPVQPPGQSYRHNAPVPPPAPMGVVPEAPSTRGGTMLNNPYAPDPQNGAPTLFNPYRSLAPPVPGSMSRLAPILAPGTSS